MQGIQQITQEVNKKVLNAFLETIQQKLFQEAKIFQTQPFVGSSKN